RAAARPGGADTRRRGDVEVRGDGGVGVGRSGCVGFSGEGMMAREDLAVPRAEFASYYGRPILKHPVWEWKIAAYLFAGGLSAGSAMLAAGADGTGRQALRGGGGVGAVGR